MDVFQLFRPLRPPTAAFCCLALAAFCSTAAGQPGDLVFSGKENYGLLFVTVSQTGAVRLNLHMTIKNKRGRVAGRIRFLPLDDPAAGRGKKNDSRPAARMHILRLKPGLYTVSGYQGRVYKRYHSGIKTFRFAKRNIAYRFRIGRGLTAYLGNIRFDFTQRGRIRVSVKDMIEQDMQWLRKKYPHINALTLDRQVIDPRYSNRHRYYHRY